MTMKILLMPGLTLPEISADDVARVRAAAGSDAEVIVTTPAEALKHAEQAEVILGPVPRQLFQAAPRLRWVQATSSGVDPYMYPELRDSKVILTSEKGLVGEHLADHAFGLLLLLTRQPRTLRMGPTPGIIVRRCAPDDRAKRLTMGIVGLAARAAPWRGGHTPLGCTARRLTAMPSPTPGSTSAASGIFPELLATSDVVAICCPLTPETRGLFNTEAFAAMKPSAFLVNVTRGEVIVEDALVRALHDKQIRGAALDVAPREPLPPDSALWDMDNVVMTPHTAGASQYRAGRNIDRFVRNLEHLRHNEPLEGVINKQLGY
jgi:phosphoglycerate dehydrogenase-like enzyme